MNSKILNNYFFVLFSLIPASIIFGPAISLINILLINFSFICLLIYTKEYKFLLNKTVKLLLIFYLCLIFNSIISENSSIGILRNFGFIRFIILFCAFNYFFYHKIFFKKILITWTLTVFILTIDAYIESYTGRNILGYGEEYGDRIVSFFKDEPIVGGYINAFYLIIVGYLFSLSHKFSVHYKYIILAVSIFFLLAILLTGERSNAIKATLGFMLFYYINNNFRIKEKLIAIFLTVILIGSLINNSEFLKSRYKEQFLNTVDVIYKSKFNKDLYKQNFTKHYFGYHYTELYISGFKVFKDYPFFGVGNKNYRHVACDENNNYKYICTTHPHQIYFELLAEHGLLGTAVLLFIIFNLVFSKSKIILQSKNYIQIGTFIFLFNSLIPFLPSGAFFADYNLNIFWLNLSLMYSVNNKTNIFSKN